MFLFQIDEYDTRENYLRKMLIIFNIDEESLTGIDEFAEKIGVTSSVLGINSIDMIQMINLYCNSISYSINKLLFNVENYSLPGLSKIGVNDIFNIQEYEKYIDLPVTDFIESQINIETLFGNTFRFNIGGGNIIQILPAWFDQAVSDLESRIEILKSGKTENMLMKIRGRNFTEDEKKIHDECHLAAFVKLLTLLNSENIFPPNSDFFRTAEFNYLVIEKNEINN